MKISVVSGGFDPVHSGHIEYLKAAKNIGDYLIVALNSDNWLTLKKGKPFMSYHERLSVLSSFSFVDEVVSFEDDDLGSCINALEQIKLKFPKDEIIFCNGGDRNSGNIPEMQVRDISLKFGVGGESKINSSSKILKQWKGLSEERIWGEFYNLYQDKKIKLKELIIKPGKGMSLQKHFKRSEIWFVSEGKCCVNFHKNDHSKIDEIPLNTFDTFSVKKEEWHQLFNPYKEECRIIEIQFGEENSEEDIERIKYYDGNE